MSATHDHPTIGLALGSGGVRGFAHLGVLEVLEAEGLTPGVIAGSSSGAALGAMYAFRPRAAANLTHVERYLHSELYDTTKLSFMRQRDESSKTLYESLRVRLAQGAVFAASLTKASLFDEQVLRRNVEYLVDPLNIEEAFIKLAVVSFDMTTGEEIVDEEGPLVEAIMGSCALPGVFPAVPRGERLLMDGGIVNPVPVDHARRLGADLLIAVDVVPTIDPLPTLGSSYEVAMRAADVTRYHLKSRQFAQSPPDVTINVDLASVFWADFNQFDYCVQAGRDAAREALPNIRSAVARAEGIERPGDQDL